MPVQTDLALQKTEAPMTGSYLPKLFGIVFLSRNTDKLIYRRRGEEEESYDEHTKL